MTADEFAVALVPWLVGGLGAGILAVALTLFYGRR
jgi:hypothetical protein